MILQDFTLVDTVYPIFYEQSKIFKSIYLQILSGFPNVNGFEVLDFLYILAKTMSDPRFFWESTDTFPTLVVRQHPLPFVLGNENDEL